MEDDILKKIQYFAELFADISSKDENERKNVEPKLLKVINNLKSDELKFLSEYYNIQGYVKERADFQKGILKKGDGGAVNVLRYNLLQHILRDEELTSDIIETEKQKIKEIVEKYDKNYNPFRNWKNDRILYPFCYYYHKEEIKDYLEKFTNKLRKKLNIIDKTKINIVTFDGATNLGFDHCWIAIYDERFKSQQETKQIYVGFYENKIVFDIYEHKIEKWGSGSIGPSGEILYDNFNFEILIDFFKEKKEAIFELRHLEKDLDATSKKFQENKKFTKKEKYAINKKMYLEESKFDSVFQVVNRKNHHYKIYNSTRGFFEDNFDEYGFEKENIDITTIKDNEIYLFEIKPFEDSRYTIRTALGQLLEYYYKNGSSAKYLCFVGLKPLGENKIYFDYLQNIFRDEKFKLRYYYVDYEKGVLIEDEG